MKKSVTALSMIVLVVFVLSMFAGCKSQTSETTQSVTTAVVTTTEKVTEPVTLKIGLQIHADDTANISLPFFQELMKRTNVKLEIISLGDGDILTQKRNLLLAAGEIFDLLSITKGMANTYGDENVYIPVDELLQKYAPDIVKILDYNQTLSLRNSKDNKLYYIPRYYELSGTVENSLNYRKDILDSLGISEPRNMDEWYNAFKMVKEKFPDIIPLCERGRYLENILLSAFDMADLWYGSWGMIGSEMDKKKVVYLPATDNWKEFLMYFHKLYQEKLIDQEYLTIQYENWWNKITTGKAFACSTMNFARVEGANITAEKQGIKQQWMTALYPENKSGKRQIFLPVNPWLTNGMAISAKSTHAKEAVEFCNYLYSEEGIILFQYGIEGVSYKKDQNNNPVKLPEGKTGDQNKIRYDLGMAFYLPTAQLIRDQVDITVPTTKDHFDKNPPLLVKMPNLRIVDANEINELDTMEADLYTYRAEMMDRFIIGQESFDNWDNYLKQLEKLGAGKCTAYVQKWFDAYYAASK